MNAQRLLKAKGQWQELRGQLLSGNDAAATVAYILSGHAEAGIIYETDLKRSDALVPVHTFRDFNSGVWAVPVHGANGSAFVRFLSSEAGQHHLRTHGFNPASNMPLEPSIAESHEEPIADVILLSLKVGLLSVIIILPFGIFFGWLLARREFPGKSLLNAVIHVPLVLPPVVTGYLLLWSFGRDGALGGLGLAFTWAGAALASAIVAFPLFVRAVRLGFEAVDPKLEQAAMTLGASRSRVFFRISLPLCLGAIISGSLLAFGRALGEFGATITFAGSIIGETETLPLAIYAALQSPSGHETVATLALISTLLAFGTLILGEWLARRVAWKH